MDELKQLIGALWEISTPKWERWKPKRRTFSPEDLLEAAKRQMEWLYAHNRERAVQAITQKNQLQQMADDLERKVKALGEKASLADERGDEREARQLRRERRGYEKSLVTTRESLVNAIEMAEVVKNQIQREQEEIRRKTAELLARKSEWQASQITQQIERELRREVGVCGPGFQNFEMETVRTLVGILLGVILVLLIVVGGLLAVR